MSHEEKPREFYLSTVDLDFDLNCKKVLACEYPHKDYDLTLFTKVIEYSAYQALLEIIRAQRDALKGL